MSQRMTKLAALLICLACCVFVGGSGCSVHRTGEGFVFDSHWSLECSERAPWVDFRPAEVANADAKPGAAAAPSGGADATAPPTIAAAEQPTAAKPELLPWRSRLKARLAARGSPGKEAADGTAQATASGSSSEAVSTVSDDSPRETGAATAATLVQPQAGPAAATPPVTRPDPVLE